MDEEALFRDIHHHILRQAKAGERIDTETELAHRFNVTRYKVRKALSVLSQMGVVDRAPKRGMTVNALGPKIFLHKFRCRWTLRTLIFVSSSKRVN